MAFIIQSNLFVTVIHLDDQEHQSDNGVKNQLFTRRSQFRISKLGKEIKEKKTIF